MSKLLALAAISIATLAACAPAEVRNGSSTAAAAPAGTQYCSKVRLVEQTDKLACNWAASKADACRFQNVGYLARSSVVSEPVNAGRCENGEWLVQVTTR